jgi:hypothetical protein
MKIFLHDFTMYSDIVICKSSDYVLKKNKEYGISLNQDKCAFMVFSRMILDFIVSKEGKLPNPRKYKQL